MTDPADFEHDDQLLPGLAEPAATAGALERAAHRSITGLEARLDETHAVMCEALIIAARQLDRAAASTRAKPYGVADLLAQLRETWSVLVGDEDGGEGGDAFDRLARELGRAAAVRDGTEPAATE